MIERYSREKMRNIWSLQNQYQSWLEVEILSCEAWSKLGHIPEEDVKKIRENATFTVERCLEIEESTRHDVVAFTRCVSESLGDEKKWVHYGLTSTDVCDTALGYRIKQADEIIREDLLHFKEVLRQKAIQYKHTVMMGRTHGVHAEITTFGLTMLLWYEEICRDIDRFEDACKSAEAGKISGAVGTHANVPIFVEEYVCEHLGTTPAKVSTQTLQRDRFAYYMSVLALIGSSLEKMAVQIRHMQRTEVREVEEHFSKGQKGSSAMPHKRNPIGSENICGLSRVLRGNMMAAYEDMPLWHERDISHSSVERVIIPDSTMLLDYMLVRFSNIVENLTVFEDNMKENIGKTYGVIFSQRVLTALVDKGLAREEAYDTVQPKAMDCWENRKSFKEAVENDEKITSYLSQEEIDDCFDQTYHLKAVDEIFARCGLE